MIEISSQFYIELLICYGAFYQILPLLKMQVKDTCYVEPTGTYIHFDL